MFRFVLSLFFILSCQIKPTQIKEEAANQDNKNLILVDTRSAFEFTSFHISGSVNINSGDYLILKKTKPVKRILDPDITQIVERLARRGISPFKSVILISNIKDSEENKKWKWLFRKLGVQDVVMMGFDEYRAKNKNNVPQSLPIASPIWEVKNIESILIKAEKCFVNWSDEICVN